MIALPMDHASIGVAAVVFELELQQPWKGVKMTDNDTERMLTTGEVAVIFRVSPHTVGAWAKSGRIRHILTPGGHRRFRQNDVQALLDSGKEDAR